MNRVQYRSALTIFTAALSAAATIPVLAAPVPSRVRVPEQGFQAGNNGSVTKSLHTITTIGSTVDPMNGDQNPYGLAVAPVTSGKIHAGDLVICNFNDGFNNIQGLGTTIELLHPVPGSKPQRFFQDTRLTGCNAISLASDDDELWVAAFTANDNPVITSGGDFELNLAGPPYASPWGQTFSATHGPYGKTAFYESNSNDGSIMRISINGKDKYKTRIIATGFSVNHGVPGTVLAPSGLTYDPATDTLYIVDGNANRVVAFSHVTMIPPNGITVNGSGFGGPSGSMARVVAKGKPLAQPISAALLYNGNLVVGNTTNNLLVEIDPRQNKVVHMVNLDKGAAGALFGIAAIGTSTQNTVIYFNDDNTNTVDALSM